MDGKSRHNLLDMAPKQSVAAPAPQRDLSLPGLALVAARDAVTTIKRDTMSKNETTAKPTTKNNTDASSKSAMAANSTSRTSRKLPSVKSSKGQKIRVPSTPALLAENAGNRTRKLDTVINLLRAKTGASIEQVSQATGWQAHSIRGAISGQLKKKLGLNVQSEKVDGTRLYRIAK